MDKIKKYYTIAEFANRLGISKQAAYKKISRNLSSFCKWENGRKYISEDALDSIVTDAYSHNDRQEVDNLSSAFRTLQLQLAEKDLQIERKDRQIESLHVQISELTKAFREAQALHAGTLQRELSDNSTGNNKHRWWQFWHQKD